MAEELKAQWKCGNEFAPFHPQASHVDPSYRDGWNHCHAVATATIASLREELERVRKDAERYQWLRENCLDWEVDGEHRWGALHFDNSSGSEGIFADAPESLDAAIDAAMKEPR
jgi:hypothetical protein